MPIKSKNSIHFSQLSLKEKLRIFNWFKNQICKDQKYEYDKYLIRNFKKENSLWMAKGLALK